MIPRKQVAQGGTGRKARGLGKAGAAVAVLAGSLALAGCETLNDNVPDVGFRVLEPSEKPKEQVANIMPQVVLSPVAEIDGIQLGTLYRGVLLSATGHAAGMGWFQAQLNPRNRGQISPDGFLEFDFVAGAPEANGGAPQPVGTETQRRISAYRALTEKDLRGVQGIRVYAASGVAAARLSAVNDPAFGTSAARPTQAASRGGAAALSGPASDAVGPSGPAKPGG